MNVKKFYQGWDVYVNSTRLSRYYSKKKAVNIGQIESANLFEGQKHVEVVDTYTGEVVWNN